MVESGAASLLASRVGTAADTVRVRPASKGAATRLLAARLQALPALLRQCGAARKEEVSVQPAALENFPTRAVTLRQFVVACALLLRPVRVRFTGCVSPRCLTRRRYPVYGSR